MDDIKGPPPPFIIASLPPPTIGFHYETKETLLNGYFSEFAVALVCCVATFPTRQKLFDVSS